jgi:hypothetical protein
MTENIHVMDKTYVVLSESVVGVATGYGLGGEESSPGMSKIFLLSTSS